MDRPKRVAAIHDLSVFGRCSLSVITPIISCLGVQVLPIPCVLMSTHTGGFTNIEFSNCGDFVSRTAKHLKNCNAEIDCIYSGYIANKTAFDGIYDFFKLFPNAKRIIDPVLGDHGKLYSALDKSNIEYMQKLIKHADLITPNLTEVSLLLNTNYKEIFTLEEIKSVLNQLSLKTEADIVITGVTLEKAGKCNVCKTKDKCFYVPCFYQHHSYEGTGDIFTSVVTACITKGTSLSNAVITASDFVEKTIEISYSSNEPTRDGVFIEHALPELINNKNVNRQIINI